MALQRIPLFRILATRMDCMLTMSVQDFGSEIQHWASPGRSYTGNALKEIVVRKCKEHLRYLQQIHIQYTREAAGVFEGVPSTFGRLWLCVACKRLPQPSLAR